MGNFYFVDNGDDIFWFLEICVEFICVWDDGCGVDVGRMYGFWWVVIRVYVENYCIGYGYGNIGVDLGLDILVDYDGFVEIVSGMKLWFYYVKGNILII